eukprot:386447_1
MPLVKRRIPYALRLADKDLYGQGETGAATSNGPAILRDVNMGSMTGTLQQLGYLAAYSSEMFQELLTLTDEVSSRAASLKERCTTLEEKLPNAIGRTTNAVKGQVAVEGDDLELLEVLRASRAHANQVQAKETMSILLPQSMPLPLAERYYSDEVTPMPALERIDECLGDVGLAKLAAKGLSTYSFEYSHPGFFYEEWQRLESQRLDRLIEEKKQRKTERRARKKREAELAVSQNEIGGGANALAMLDGGTASEHQELSSGSGSAGGGPQKNLKGSLVGRHKRSRRSEQKDRQKGKKSSAAVAMVSHETVVVEDVDTTKDALVYQRDEYEGYLVPSYPTDLQQMSKPKQHDVTSLEQSWNSTAPPSIKRSEAAHFAFMPKKAPQTAGGNKAVQAMESIASPATTPTVLPQGQVLSTDETSASTPTPVLPQHSRALPVPPTHAPVGPEATAALFATKRRKQYTTPLPPAPDVMRQVHKEAISVPPVAPPPPPVPESKSKKPVSATAIAPAKEAPGPERTERTLEKTLPAPLPPPTHVVPLTIRPPPPALPAEMPVRTPPFVPPPPPPPIVPDIVAPPLPSNVIPISSPKSVPSPQKPPTTAASPQASVFHKSLHLRSSTPPQPESSSSSKIPLVPSPHSLHEYDGTSESTDKLPTTTTTSMFSFFPPPDDEVVSPPPLVPPPAPPEKTLELSELVEVLSPTSIAPPVPPPAKALELKELVEVLPSPTVSSLLPDHVEHVVVVEKLLSPPLPPVTSPSLKLVEPIPVVPPIPTGIAPQPPTSPSSDTVPVSAPPPPPMTAQMLERNKPGGGLSLELPIVLESTILIAPNLSSDSMSHYEDSSPPLQVTNSSRGIGDLLESIRGGTKQLKKVEPDTQQTMPQATLGAFANPGINTILERRKYLEADDSDSETDSDDDWE